jgi:hypothetical protein
MEGDMRKMRAIVILFMMLTAASAWAGTLVDDFSDGDFDGWGEAWMLHNQTTWKVESGVLTGDNPSQWGTYLIIGDMAWQDYEVEVDARLTTIRNGGASIEIGLRQNGQVGAQFKAITFVLMKASWVGPEGAYALYFANNAVSVRKTIARQFEIGKWYHLKVTVQGDHYQFYVDGSKEIDIHFKTLESGGVALGAHAGVAQYDNVSIKGDAVPDLGLSVSPVSPQGKNAILWAELKSIK